MIKGYVMVWIQASLKVKSEVLLRVEHALCSLVGFYAEILTHLQDRVLKLYTCVV